MIRWWMAQDILFKFSALVFVCSSPAIAWLLYVSAFWNPN